VIKEFEKQSDHAFKAPFVECSVDGHSFPARLDTGADISIVPIECLDNKVLLNPIKIRVGDGEVRNIFTYKADIKIAELGTFTLEKGIILTDDSKGLIGMDILNK
jgi:hypothetical protein